MKAGMNNNNNLFLLTVTVECDPDRGSEYNTENDTEDTGEEAALLGSSESPLTNSPGSINPGGNTDPMK